jgi:hypothetical protein
MSGWDILGGIFAQSAGGGRVCPPVIRTGLTVIQTTPIIAILRIRIIVSDEPGVIMRLRVMIAQDGGRSIVWFSPERLAHAVVRRSEWLIRDRMSYAVGDIL